MTNSFDTVQQQSDKDALLVKLLLKRITERSYKVGSMRQMMLKVQSWGRSGKDVVGIIIQFGHINLAQASLAVPSLQPFWNSQHAVNVLCKQYTSLKLVKSVLRHRNFHCGDAVIQQASNIVLPRTLKCAVLLNPGKVREQFLGSLQYLVTKFPENTKMQAKINKCLHTLLTAVEIDDEYLRCHDLELTKCWHNFFFRWTMLDNRKNTLPLFLSTIYAIKIEQEHQQLFELIKPVVHNVQSRFENLQSSEFLTALHEEMAEILPFIIEQDGQNTLRDLMEF